VKHSQHSLDRGIKPGIFAPGTESDKILLLVDEAAVSLHELPVVLDEVDHALVVTISWLVHGDKVLGLLQKGSCTRLVSVVFLAGIRH
jgi:hypothetical protein